MHYCNGITHLFDNLKIVGDEQDRKIGLFLDGLYQGKYLRLNREIKCGSGFVGNDKFGVEGKDSGKGYPLLLAPGYFERVPVDQIRVGARPAREGLGYGLPFHPVRRGCL